ncbi:MAG: 50S ribosome-binding GTPase, partial [Synergistaceae bacterium]|nr:50S ribosome-binding GTPase [Synergistaceae bacterium]
MPRTVWYPGHMAKGSRKLRELAERLDVIVEVRDSRAPSSTSSPLIKSLAKIKPVIRVLSRKDLADPEKLALWVNSLKFAHTADLRKREGISQIRRDILKFKPAHREVRLAVVGIPNVGKSLLLNTLVGKSSASVGNIPGVTKSVNWYKNEGMLIVDSPGILDPHAEPGAHMMLSWLGCAKADVVGGWENSAISLVKFLT